MVLDDSIEGIKSWGALPIMSDGQKSMYLPLSPYVTQGIFLGIVGSIFYTSLFIGLHNLILRTRFGDSFRDKYHLSVCNALDICNKLVSAVQAVAACWAGFVIISSCTTDILKDSHHLVTTFAWFDMSYFWYDIWSMYYVHCYTYGDTAAYSKDRVCRFIVDRPVIIVHHLILAALGVPLTLMPSIRNGRGDCIIALVFLMEFSTPFVSLRVILSRLKMKSSWMYTINGILMIITFFFFRVMTFPFIYYVYSRQQGRSIFEVVTSIAIYCNVGSLIMTLPQIYWFVLMVRGAVKLLLPPRSKSGSILNDKMD